MKHPIQASTGFHVISMVRLGFLLLLPLYTGAELTDTMQFEAEDWTEPSSAWNRDRHTQDHWNLWSTDKDAHLKWSGGVVLQSPKVLKDRDHPGDGAPPLHTRITGIPTGSYDISLNRVGRTLGVSLDGKTWKPYRGGILVEEQRITNGVFEVWVDDRFVHPDNPGSGYYDTINLSPIPRIVPKPRVTGLAIERVEESLDRGLMAVPCEDGVYLGWRLLKTDPLDIGFNVYRTATGTEPERLNAAPVRVTTDYLDRNPLRDADGVYSLRTVRNGREDPEAVRVSCNVREKFPGYISMKLDGDHTFQKAGIGDLDGDGAYDFVIKQPNANVDPGTGYWRPSPGTYKLEAYLQTGRLLWRKDLGWAIEQGIWYSPYLVYDFDGDGKAEVAAKLGDGDPREPDGRVRHGPEWLVVWDGLTGKERARAAWPNRERFASDIKGYNRASRNQLAVAYLDGKTPCLVALRGTYGTMKADAYAFREGRLQPLWQYRDTDGGPRYQGQGAHFTHAADIDGDGRDEVILGSAVIDDNGSPLWSTRLGHPDHCYVGDIDPYRPGLEIYYGIERRQQRNGMCLVDAATGTLLWGWDRPTIHIHSCGLCADIDPTVPGVEAYSADSQSHKPTGDRWLWSATGRVLNRDLDLRFGYRTVYWDADLQRELIRGTSIEDFGGTPHPPKIDGKWILTADVLGDWREEIITTVRGELRIYTTTVPAMDRRVTLMQDPIYRADIVMCSMGYPQVPMTSYCLEARSPNLNLTRVGDAHVRVVVSAPLDRPIRGRLRMEAEGVSIHPAEAELNIDAGTRRELMVQLKPGSNPIEGSWLHATLAGEGLALENRIRL